MMHFLNPIPAGEAVSALHLLTTQVFEVKHKKCPRVILF
jgi:hypothetical protein